MRVIFCTSMGIKKLEHRFLHTFIDATGGQKNCYMRQTAEYSFGNIWCMKSLKLEN